MTTFGEFSRHCFGRIGYWIDRDSWLSARSGMSIDVRVFEHERYEGVLLEKPLVLGEQKRCLGSRREYWFRNNIRQDPTPYLPRPDYAPPLLPIEH